MKEFFPVLHTAALFSGISDDELAAMLSCLGARIDTFPKGSRLLRAGDAVEEVGLVLAGSVLIVQEDIWGNRNILSTAGPGLNINHSGLHRHSAYILQNSDLPGFNQEQQLMMATLVRYHRKAIKLDDLPRFTLFKKKQFLPLIQLLRLGVLLNNQRQATTTPPTLTLIFFRILRIHQFFYRLLI